MTNVTTILANESGIQYQGVEDRTSGTGSYPVIGLITGSFKRGRFDKPMTITSRNIRGQLGYDPKNPHYQAVEDVLNSGVPSVQVLRVKSSNLFCQEINDYQWWELFPIENSENVEADLNTILQTVTVKINGVEIPRTEDFNQTGISVWLTDSSIRLNIKANFTYNSAVVCAGVEFDMFMVPV